MNHPEQTQRFERVLYSAIPHIDLYDLAVSLRDEGMPQVAICGLFEYFFIAALGDDPKSDAIAATMDPI